MDCKKFLFVFVFAILLIGLVSAEWFTIDNTKDYNPESKEVIIKDLTGNIGGARLRTPQVYETGLGYQKIAEFDLWAYENYNDIIKSIEFYDKNKNDWENHKLQKNFDLKYLTFENVTVDVYENILVGNYSNGTIHYDTVFTGTEVQLQEKWIKLTPASLKKNEFITVGVFTEVKLGDHVEWIPKLFGVEIEEWAEYSAPQDIYHNVDLSSSGGTSNRNGFLILTGPTAFKVNQMHRHPSCTANTAYIDWENGTEIASASFSGNTATFAGEIVLQPNTYYRLVAKNAGGGSYTQRYVSSANFPVDNTTFTWVTGSANGNNDSFAFNIVGANVSEQLNGPAVTHNSPANNTYTNQLWQLINVTATDVEKIDNVTIYYTDGLLNFEETNDSGLQGNYIFNISILGDGFYDYYVTAVDNTSLTDSTVSRRINFDTSAPAVNITNPIGSVGYSSNGSTVQLNWTATDSVLDTCWYDFNFVNTTATCGDNGALLNITSIENDNVTFWANDSAGNSAYDYEEWSYSIFQDTLTYNESVYETQLAYFLVETTYDNNSISSLTAILNYNGTNYTADNSISGNKANFSYSLYPSGIDQDTNITFFWYFNADGDIYESDSNNQTVEDISFEICESGWTPYLNITTYDQFDSSVLNTTFEITIASKLDEGSSGVFNDSYSDLSEGNNTYHFCYTPNNTNYTVDATIEVGASGYTSTNYYLVDQLLQNGSSLDIEIYLINDSLATLTEVKVVDNAFQGVENVYVTVEEYDVGTGSYYQIAVLNTNSEGSDLVYLNWYDTFYRFTGVYNSEQVFQSSNEKISATPRTFQILTGGGSEYDNLDAISYTLTYDDATTTFNFIYTIQNDDIGQACMETIKRNQTNDYQVCSTCSTSTSATIFCNIGSEGNGTFIATAYTIAAEPLDSGEYPQLIIDSISKIIGQNTEIFNEIGNLDGSALAFIMAGTISFVFFISPVLGVLAAVIGVGISMAVGFQPLDYLILTTIIVLGGIVALLLKK